MDTEKLIGDYAAVAVQLRESVAGLTTEQQRARPIAGKWSIHEVVCHIADFEPISTVRIGRVIAEEKPTLMGANETAFARALAYDARDFEEQLRLIEILRSHTARILRTLPASAFQRVGIHSEDGPLTLEKLIVRVTNHLPHHIAFIRDKRTALGV